MTHFQQHGGRVMFESKVPNLGSYRSGSWHIAGTVPDEEVDKKMILAVLVTFVIPVTLLVWVVEIIFHPNLYAEGDWQPISPWRWLATMCLPLYISYRGLKKKSLDRTGALAAIVVGSVLTLSHASFMASLLGFFLSASKATKFRSKKKSKLEENFKEGGQRNWLQVVCNGGVATEVAILYLIDIGAKERLINFSSDYNASWYSMAILGCMASAGGDTFASEFGPVLGWSEPRLITNFSKVPKGTNGAISLVGTLASIIGGLIPGLGFYAPLWLFFSYDHRSRSPPQWPVVLVGALAGFLGSVVDSILGATVQYSGYNRKTKCVVETPGSDVEHISGKRLLDNHSVNLVTSLIMCLLTPYMSYHIWWYLEA